MGIVTNSNVGSNLPTYNLRYSQFLGMMYVSDDKSETVIREAKALVGEAEVKKGYAGNRGDTATAKALAYIRERGITPVSLTGTLTSARVVEREINGRPAKYLTVGFKDADGRYYLSVELNAQGAQMLARKLVNAQPDMPTELGLFATIEQKPGRDRAFAEHGCSLKQNGTQVPGVSPKDELMKRIEINLKALQEAGITEKEILNKKRNMVTLEYHVELMEKVAKKFAAYYEERELPQDDHAVTPQSTPAAYDDFSDDVPFDL